MIKKIILLLLLLFGLNAYALNIDKSMSGSWFDQANPGQGINIEILSGNRILIYWYTYDKGNPLWLTGVGTYQGDKADIELSQFDGSNFGINHNHNLVSSKLFGSLSITFDSCNTGNMTYNSVQGLGSGSINLDRLTEITELPCVVPTTPTTPFSQNVTDTNGLRITPRTCNLLGETLTCEFSVTSLVEDVDVSFTAQSMVNSAGIVHEPTSLTLGLDTRSSVPGQAVEQSLTREVPVIGNVIFSGITASIQMVDLLKLSFRKSDIEFDVDYFDAIVVNQN
ncbi:MAG: hypothetical protein V3U88_08390 [Methylococcales bacterium]